MVDTIPRRALAVLNLTPLHNPLDLRNMRQLSIQPQSHNNRIEVLLPPRRLEPVRLFQLAQALQCQCPFVIGVGGGLGEMLDAGGVRYDRGIIVGC